MEFNCWMGIDCYVPKFGRNWYFGVWFKDVLDFVGLVFDSVCLLVWWLLVCCFLGFSI